MEGFYASPKHKGTYVERIILIFILLHYIMNSLVKSFLVGVAGDAALQTIALVKPNFAGLGDYFKIHGPFKSVMIAGSMLAGFDLVYQMTGLPVNFVSMAIYGGVLDVAFRYGHPYFMPSLSGYYEALSFPVSVFWGAFSEVLPLFF